MYRINKSFVTDEDGVKHETYGISFDDKNIYDISTEKDKVEKLIKLCNENDASPLHINDIIEDFLVDFEI